MVTLATPRAPDVFPLSPCTDDLSTSSEVSLACLITSYFPQPVTVSWNSGAISRGIQTYPAVLDSSSHHYIQSSRLTIPVSRWKSEKFHCNIGHSATSSTVNREIGACEDPVPATAPEVQVFRSSSIRDSSDASIEMLCIASGFYPSDLEIQWFRGDETPLVPSATEQPRKDAKGHTFTTYSRVNVSQEDWLDGNTYTCQATHAATQTTVKATARRIEGSSTDIKAFIQRPAPIDIYLEKQPKLTCVVTSLEGNTGLEVTWASEKSSGLNQEPTVWKQELNGTFTASISMNLSDRDWLSGQTFTCTVKHRDLPLAKNVKINHKKGDSTAPSVYLFRPHNEELNSNSESLSLTALIRGFIPQYISVMWLKSGDPVAENSSVDTPVFSDGNGSNFMYSKLTVPKADWNRGDSYTCMVVHEGLRMKFIQKSIEKVQGKK